MNPRLPASPPARDCSPPHFFLLPPIHRPNIHRLTLQTPVLLAPPWASPRGAPPASERLCWGSQRWIQLQNNFRVFQEKKNPMTSVGVLPPSTNVSQRLDKVQRPHVHNKTSLSLLGNINNLPAMGNLQTWKLARRMFSSVHYQYLHRSTSPHRWSLSASS